MGRGRSWVVSLGIHLALLLGVAALIGEPDERVDFEDVPEGYRCDLPIPIRKWDRIDRLRDVFVYRGNVPPQFMGVTRVIEESWHWRPGGITFFLYFPEGQAPCPQCIRMMQEAVGERGRKAVVVPHGRGLGTYVGWTSSIEPWDSRPRHPGGCRAYHLLGVDAYCTCCSVVEQRASSMGEKPQ
jgi:hypothetical protein